ncbi:GNAT family N-acetyltransferase [uncultured Shewanella sp.]|uniref:GNAT family N-acetyltransferase n=1 Tax=uncultured Shewanella sp. TaxID=173975 RepID=UPI0037046DCE
MINIIANGSVAGEDGKDHLYEVKEGIDLLKTMKIQSDWTDAFIKRFSQLIIDNPSTTQAALITDNNLQDSHWDWINKAIHLNTSDYIWFSLEIDNHIQAVVVIFHPKKSRIEDRDVYYIDYLAVAPWNRVIGQDQRQFKGLGSLLLKEAGKYIDSHLLYQYGFSLHSLPQAATYYQRIGMVDFGPDPTKDNLHYFEMDSVKSEVFVYA